MQIGEVARKANVSIQTLRYYERLGLLNAPKRKPSGYRKYDAREIQRVRFIKRAQDLGFALAEISDLLTLWKDASHSCALVERRASSTLERINTKIQDLETMRAALEKYVMICRTGQSLDECPLLRALGDEGEQR